MMALRLPHRLIPHAGNLAMMLAYFLLAAISLRFTRFDGGAAFVWLPGPLLFAGLTVVQRRKRLSLALWCVPAMIVASGLFGLGWKAAIPLSIANVGESLAAAWCVRRIFPRFGQFRSAGETLWFVLIGGMTIPFLVACMGALFIHLSVGAPYWPTWRDWFTAHAVGVIAFGPPLILLLGGHAKRWIGSIGRARAVEASAIMLAVAAVASVTFGQSRIPLLAVPFIPMMLATLRFGRFGAVSSVVILITIASACSLSGIGPTMMIHGGMGLRLQVLQLYFATVVLVVLPTAGELKARRRVYERLRAAEAINRLMLDHSSDIILRLNRDGIIQYVSPAISRIQGTVPAKLVGRQFELLLQEKDRQRVMAAHRTAIASPTETLPVEWQTVGAMQPARSFEAHAKAIVDDQGVATGVLYVVRDVTERTLRSMELEVRANTDPLTGLVNRRVFDMALDASIADADRAVASLAIFDLDHFKSVNDRYGHISGDLVLTRFAEILKTLTRGDDIAARLGGEEFAVILRNADHLEAVAICERIRTELAGSTILATGGSPLSVTVSAGLKQISQGLSREALIDQADQALYQAKNSGRNRVALAA